MTQWLARLAKTLLGVCALSSGACSGEGANETRSTGTITDHWRSYCIATFTEDHIVRDSFDDALFTAMAGEEYLMGHYGERFDQHAATLLYLTDRGPKTFEIGAPLGSRDFPFTTNCEFDGAVDYYAVFDDVAVHATETLDDRLCDLTENSAMRRDTAAGSGYAATGFSLGGPATYELILNVFSEACGGAERGYISVPQSRLFGSTTWLVPVVAIIGPE